MQPVLDLFRSYAAADPTYSAQRTELGTGFDARFAVVFQKPCTPRWPFGSVHAFGHDGAGGSLAFSDPGHDVAFGYTVQRLPLPGGMDRRAVDLAAAVRDALRAT